MTIKAARDMAGSRRAWRTFAVLVLALLSGCAGLPKDGDSRGLILLLSGNQPAYSQVASEIRRRHQGPVEIHVLGGARSPSAVRVDVQGSGIRKVVAIGEEAARLARVLRDKHVVFCQILTYEELGLVTPWMKGVAVLPPADRQLRTWKTISPGTRRVGLVTGPNLRHFVAEARIAARAHGILLQHIVVRDDREFLYAYKRLLANVDGMWLIPDHRVLSSRAIHDALASSVKSGKQVLVFHRDLLELGGLLSAETDPADVAEQVLARLNSITNKDAIPGAPVLALKRARLQVNGVLVGRYGLRVPPGIAGGGHGR